MDKISVLICCHSQDIIHDRLLERSLSSLMRQTYQPDEIILILDECHSDTIDMLGNLQYYDWRDTDSLKIYERPRKLGLADAKNYGLQKCNYDYVAYQDADDASLVCRLELQRNFLLQHPDIDMLFTECFDVYNPGEINEVWYPNCFKVGQYKTHEQISERIKYENVLAHGSLLGKKSVLLSNGGYDTDKRYLGREDWKKWYDLITAGYKFHKLDERLYLYSMHTGVER